MGLKREEEKLQRALAAYFHSSRLCRHHRLGPRSGSKGISLMALPLVHMKPDSLLPYTEQASRFAMP